MFSSIIGAGPKANVCTLSHFTLITASVIAAEDEVEVDDYVEGAV